MESPSSVDPLDRWSEFMPGPVHQIYHDWSLSPLHMKRLDLIRSWAAGNKYYKLKYNIHHVLQSGMKKVVSKGGMFSNHLEALAKACAYFDIECICIIRTYVVDENNPTVKALRACGAQLVFLSPEQYQSFDDREAKRIYPDAFFIPEGGANELGIKGASEMVAEIDSDSFTHLVIAGGTISSAIGILSAASSSLKVIIVPAWKGCTRTYVDDLFVQYNIEKNAQWDLWPEYHFGGFGKYNQQLVDFMYSFTKDTNIPLDPVYTGKMMFGIKEKMQQGYFSESDKVICIHTGGLQGIEGFAYRDPVTWSKYSLH